MDRHLDNLELSNIAEDWRLLRPTNYELETNLM